MKRIIGTILALMILLAAFITPCLSVQAKTQAPSLDVLVFGNEYSQDVMKNLLAIGKSQGIDISIDLFASQKGNIDHHQNIAKWELWYCSSQETGYYYKIDNKNPEGVKQTSPQNSYKTVRAVALKDWDSIVFMDSPADSSDEYKLNDPVYAFKNYITGLLKDKSAKTYYHEYWAWEKTNVSEDTDKVFNRYNSSWSTMYEKIKHVSDIVSGSKEFDAVISSGEAFNLARTEGDYNPATSEVSLMDDDTRHLSIYGEYLSACVWYMTLTGCEIDTDKVFVPIGVFGMSKEQALELIGFAAEAVKSRGVTLKSFNEVYASQNDTNGTTSSELVYNPDDIGGSEGGADIDPMLFVYIGAGVVVVAAVAVVIVIASKKKKSK